MDNNIIVGLGEILWDIFPGRKVLGGTTANFAYHVSQLGYTSYIVSAVGNDSDGTDIEAGLKSKNMNYILEKTDFPTGKVLVTLKDEGIPEYEIVQNVAWDNIPFTNRIEALAKKTTAVCFGTLAQRSEVSKNTIRQFFENMPADSLKIMDINLRQHFYNREVIEKSLLFSNILKINDEEILKIAEIFGIEFDDERAICEYLLDKFNLAIVMLTKGHNGSYVFTPKETSYLATPRIHVADTVGAGDSFTAGFIAAYLHGERIQAAHRLAVEIAAYVCTQHGAMPILPDAYRKIFMKR